MTVPFKILVLADFRGVAATDRPDSQPITVAGQTLDALFAHFAPTARAKFGSGPNKVELEYAVSSLADFEPARVRQELERLGGTAPAADAIDSVLHATAFRRLESTWRGLERLLGLTPEGIELELLDVASRTFADDFESKVFEREYGGPEVPLSAIVADVELGATARDVATLKRLGELGRSIGVPVYAGASNEIFGVRHSVHLGVLPDLGARMSSSKVTPLASFRLDDAARWTGLTVGRWLQRYPYGALVDDGPEPDHTETFDPAEPSTLLWGNGTWLVAAAMARSHDSHGHCGNMSGLVSDGAFDGLPTAPQPSQGKSARLAATDVLLPDELASEYVKHGFTPILGRAGGDSASVLFPSNLHRPSGPRIVLQSSIAYQSLAGRLSQQIFVLQGKVAGQSTDDAATTTRDHLRAFLGEKLLGDREDAVQVTPQATEDGVPFLGIEIQLAFQLENKDVEFLFQLPLGGG